MSSTFPGTFHGRASGTFGVDSSPLWKNEGVPVEGGEDPNMLPNYTLVENHVGMNTSVASATVLG